MVSSEALAGDLHGVVLGGRYRLVALIGSGGMGTVWEAEHVEIGHKVAVKLMHSEATRDADRVARFRREAHVAGNLGHDNICNVLDIGFSDEHGLYLVMPLLRGKSLAAILDELGSLPIARALDITAQVLDALGAAHAAGIIHRDLKPDNVFVGRVGDREDFVKVLDFGISNVSAAVEGSQPLTQTGIVLGTPDYMAPEQARGRKDIDARVDLWAAGVMLYQMLTGERPFPGESANEIIVKIVTEEFTPLATLRRDVPADVQALVNRAMARDREDRFPDAASMRAAVQAAMAAATRSATGPRPEVQATPTPTPPVAPSMPSRLGAAPAAGSSGGSISTPLASEILRAEDPEGAPAGRGAARWIFALAAILALGVLLAFLATRRPAGGPSISPGPAAAPGPALQPPVTPPVTAPTPPTPVAPAPPAPATAASPPATDLPATPATTAKVRVPAKRTPIKTTRTTRTKVITLPDGTTFETSNNP